MGTYCTTTSLSIVMIGTVFDTATTALGGKCIGWAEAEINKYLSKRYDLSTSQFTTAANVPPVVTALAEQLAAGYMYKTMGRGSKEASKRAMDMIEPAIENLQGIADYKMDLLDSSGEVIADSSNSAYRVQCNTTGYPNTFNEDDELSQRVSSGKLEDIAAERDE